MGLLHVYFIAASDEQAATAVEPGPEQAGFDAVDLPNVDPTIILGSVEARLLGVDEEVVTGRPRHAGIIAQDLSVLSRRALAAGRRVYAWVSL